MSDFPTLLERVKAADGPDRALSTDVNRALRQPDVQRLTGGIDAAMLTTGPHWGPHVTASLDAVFALAERVLPGWPGWEMLLTNGDGNWRVGIGPRDTFTVFDGAAPTLTLALLAAVISAKIAETEKEGAPHD